MSSRDSWELGDELSGSPPEATPTQSLDATWSVLDREPGMDDLAEGFDEILKEIGQDLKIYPFQDTDGNDRLFLARFEFPKYGESSQFPEAVQDESVSFIDFLAGFPIDCIEMLVAIGEISSKSKEDEDSKVSVQEGTGVTAPIPSGFFVWPEKDKILLNLTALVRNQSTIFARNLDGEPAPQNVHWWFRTQLSGKENKFPVPGEFLGLGVRIMPGEYWGRQKSSPFVYSGNWMDTIWYTGGRITEVIEPEGEDEDAGKFPWKTYKVKWRGVEVNVIPTDFAEYRGPVDDDGEPVDDGTPGDRVTILKDVSTEKTSQLWKDDDMKPDTTVTGDGPGKTFIGPWQICPISFYGLETTWGE